MIIPICTLEFASEKYFAYPEFKWDNACLITLSAYILSPVLHKPICFIYITAHLSFLLDLSQKIEWCDHYEYLTHNIEYGRPSRGKNAIILNFTRLERNDGTKQEAKK